MSKKNRNFRKKNSNTKNLGIKVGDWYIRCGYNEEGNIVDRSLLKIRSVSRPLDKLRLEYTKLSLLKEVCVVYETIGIDVHTDSKHIIYYTADNTNYTLRRLNRKDINNGIEYVLGELLGTNKFTFDLVSEDNSLVKSRDENKVSEPLWKRFKDLEGKYIKFYDGYGIQYLEVREVDYDSENYEFHISGFGPYLRRGTHDGWTNYVYNKETVLQGYLLQAQEISKEEFEKAKEMLREKSSYEKTVRNFLEKDKKPLTDLIGKYLKYTQGDDRMGTMYFRLKDIRKETYCDYQYCKIRYENDRFSVNKKGKITYLTGENIHDSISFESFKDAVIITEEEFNKARSGEGIEKQEKESKKKISNAVNQKTTIEDKQITIKDFLEQGNELVDLSGKYIKFRNHRDTYTNYLKIRKVKITQQEPESLYFFNDLWFSKGDDAKLCYYDSYRSPSWYKKSWILEQAVIISEEEFNEARFGNKKTEFENTRLSLGKLRRNKKQKDPIKYISTEGDIYYLYGVTFKKDLNIPDGRGSSFRIEAIEGYSIIRGRFCGIFSKDSEFVRINADTASGQPCIKTIENPFILYFKEPEDFLNNSQFISWEEWWWSLMCYIR